MPPITRAPALAGALSVPVRALFDEDDETTLLEVTLKADSLARVKREGKPYAHELAQRFAVILEGLIMEEARRPPVNVKQGRGKRRRSREEILAGIAEAKAMSLARRARAREAAGGGGEGLSAQ